MSNGVTGMTAGKADYGTQNYSEGPKCSFGVGVARQLRAIWACLTVLLILISVQIAMTMGAMNRADRAVEASQEREVNVARLEERLTAIQSTLDRMENRLVEKIKQNEK